MVSDNVIPFVMTKSTKCRIDGCANPPHVRGYCRAHYLRLRKSGELEMNTAKLAEHGRKADHPYYRRWQKWVGNLCPAWEEDFWVFVEGVGDSGGCTKLYRLDETQPLGPGNFRWAEKLVGEAKNAYYRAWYKKSPAQRDKKYRAAYGIGLDDYETMREAQGDRCAICHEPETHIVRKGVNHDLRRLAVDHDHTTGAVRELLCSFCNGLLGFANDDPDLLRKAAAYLDKHHAKRGKRGAA